MTAREKVILVLEIVGTLTVLAVGAWLFMRHFSECREFGHTVLYCLT